MEEIDYSKINQEVFNSILGSSNEKNEISSPEETNKVMPIDKNIMVCDLWKKFADMDKDKVEIGYVSRPEEEREYGYVEIKDLILTKAEQKAG